MSTETQTTTTTTQAGAGTQEGNGAAAAAAGGASPQVTMTPDQLKTRLAEERAAGRKEMLKRYGVEKDSDLEAKLSKLTELERANLTEQEKAAARIKELEPQAQRAKELEGSLKRIVDQQIEKLPDAMREKLIARAGDDLTKRIDYLEFLHDTGALGGQQTQQQGGGQGANGGGEGQQSGTASAGQQQLQKPATTAGGDRAPKPGGQRTKWDEYVAMQQQKGDIAAEIFYKNNAAEIEKSRPADS